MFEWLIKEMANLAVSVCSFAVSLLTSAFNFDLSYFSSRLPLVGKSYEIFQTMALGFVMLFFLWQSLKMLGAPIAEQTEDPIKLIFKSILAVFCIYNAQGIFNEGFNILRPIYDMISGLSPTDSIAWNGNYSVVNGILDTALLFTGLSLVQIIVFAVMLVIVLWNLWKMLVELTERYILLGILAVTSPLGFSTMTTKATSNIFSAWMRMIIGQFIIYLLNFWIIKMFLSAFSTMPSLTNPGEAILWFIFMWAFLKVAQKLDTFLGKLGIEVGNVGGSLLEEVMIGKMAFGALGKATGLTGKGGKAGGLASALSAVKGGNVSGIAAALANKATGGVASVLVGGVAAGAGGAVGHMAMGALGKVTKKSPLGGLINHGNPLRGVSDAAKSGGFPTNKMDRVKNAAKHMGANIANATVPGVSEHKAASAAKILNENPVLGGEGKDGMEEFSKKLRSITSQNGVTEKLVNHLDRPVGGQRGIQIASGLMNGKKFGDLTPDMVKSPNFSATAYNGGVQWSHKDYENSTQLNGYMAVNGNNEAAKEALKFKKSNKDAYHYTANAPGGRKIDCVYTKSVLIDYNQKFESVEAPDIG